MSCCRLTLRLLLLPLSLWAAACGSGPGFGAPDPASREAEDTLDLWRGSVWTALAVGALVWALVVWSVLRYRRRNDDLPSQAPENIPLEIAYTVAPILIVAVLFGFTVLTQERVTALEAEPDVVVEVTGFQWSWEFAYPELDVVVESDATEVPRLVLPVGATVRFELRSTDVNHSFWVPEFLTKRDLIPGLENRLDVEVTREGTWTGRCAEFCGLDHWRMAFAVEAVPQAEFDAWVEEQG